MERNIDMGQDVEEAAKEYYESNNYTPLVLTIMNDLKISYDKVDVESIRKHHLKKGFMAGAEWQAKQSPWVSVEERLPKENEIVLCRMVSNGAIVSGYIVVEAGKPPRVATSGNFEFEDYGDYECDMWMPIPDLEE